MRRSLTAATLLVAGSAGCGRLQFDELGPGGAIDAATNGDGTDGVVGDGQTGCGGASTLFCDGLEDPSLAAWPSGFGVFQHTTARAHTGTGSLVATSDGVQAGAAAQAPFPALVSGGLHARGWFYVPSDFTILKFNIFELSGSGPGVLALVDQGNLNAYLAVAPADTIFSSMTFPLDQWVCVELDVAVADAGGSLALSLGGTQLGALTNVDTLSPGGYDHVGAGMPFAASGQEMGSVFVDDVAVSTQPIGCN